MIDAFPGLVHFSLLTGIAQLHAAFAHVTSLAGWCILTAWSQHTHMRFHTSFQLCFAVI